MFISWFSQKLNRYWAEALWVPLSKSLLSDYSSVILIVNFYQKSKYKIGLKTHYKGITDIKKHYKRIYSNM